jgi:GrpB-like predicted nucleotidyltransferase (UPF0157 family)
MKDLDQMSPEELGTLFPIILVDPDPGWADKYRAEERAIRAAFGDRRVYRIEHIGSTAIKGIRSKPSIDILLEVEGSTPDRFIIDKLEQSGYHYIHRPENPPPHMMFVRGYSTRGFRGQAFHIHLRYPGDRDEILFRDYLNGHPQYARAYEQLKISLAREFRNDREGYTEAKTDFINGILERARAEQVR